jgi:hypothetical protein
MPRTRLFWRTMRGRYNWMPRIFLPQVYFELLALRTLFSVIPLGSLPGTLCRGSYMQSAEDSVYSVFLAMKGIFFCRDCYSLRVRYN